MSRRAYLPAALAGLMVLWAPGAGARPSSLRVATEAGVVSGVEADGVRVFRNVPFAAPPVGPLRWRPPQPPVKWSGERRADAAGPACDMPDWTRAPADQRIAGPGYTMWSAKAPPGPGTSEDCLHLNIWAPAAARRAPVMVFIHGAGGSNAIPWWDGSAFAREGVLLVVMNYRQMTMGNFMHPALTRAAGPGEPAGNFQFQDQVAALRWVKRNIAAFGGDPGNVTLFGQSAGGAATLKLMSLPAAQGLFHRAIAQSPGRGWYGGWTRADAERIGAGMATAAGLPGAQATAEQLRALPRGALPWTGWFAMDGRFVPEDARAESAAARMVDVPLMVGWTSFDGSSLRYGHDEVIANTPPDVLAAYTPSGKSGLDLAYDLYTDLHVGAPARWVAGRLASGAPTYLYHFSYVRTEQRGKVRGAAHGDELTYVFDTWSKMYPNLTLSAEDRAMTRLVQSCWIAFAKTGRPRCVGAPDWPAYSPRDDRLMELGTTVAVRRNFQKARLDAQTSHLTDDATYTPAAVEKLLSWLSRP